MTGAGGKVIASMRADRVRRAARLKRLRAGRRAGRSISWVANQAEVVVGGRRRPVGSTCDGARRRPPTSRRSSTGPVLGGTDSTTRRRRPRPGAAGRLAQLGRGVRGGHQRGVLRLSSPSSLGHERRRRRAPEPAGRVQLRERGRRSGQVDRRVTGPPASAPAFLRPRGRPGAVAGRGVHELVERLADALAEHVGVGQQVAVGGDAVEHAAVVRRHADRQRRGRAAAGARGRSRPSARRRRRAGTAARARW